MKHKVLTFEEVQDVIGISWLIGKFPNITYNELISKLGEPTFIGSEDGKTNFEWTVFYEGKYYSIYDYKQDPEYTKTELTTWHIGGTSEPLEVLDFIDYIKSL